MFYINLCILNKDRIRKLRSRHEGEGSRLMKKLGSSVSGGLGVEERRKEERKEERKKRKKEREDQ